MQAPKEAKNKRSGRPVFFGWFFVPVVFVFPFLLENVKGLMRAKYQPKRWYWTKKVTSSCFFKAVKMARTYPTQLGQGRTQLCYMPDPRIERAWRQPFRFKPPRGNSGMGRRVVVATTFNIPNHLNHQIP